MLLLPAQRAANIVVSPHTAHFPALPCGARLFRVSSRLQARHAADGLIRLDGVVHGEIHGTVSGVVRAIVDGDVNVTVISGSMVEEGGADDETE